MPIDSLLIRDETENDCEEITTITAKAFEKLEISDHTEQFVIMGLRAANALTLSLVAEKKGEMVGHIAFSPVTLSDGSTDWYGLGPVSVLPEHQGKGIGSALIQEGLARLKVLGAKGCCLVGHPGYYGRFGFVNTDEFTLEGVPVEAFFALSFDGNMPRGNVAFHDAFFATGK
ncbi:MAG: GNAT family N-acetyltransferase [Chloroflexi bacterium HGW-Chloroflexi-4]|jgi:putative acetyltransferase|nr:MAG: GNAT family N-acetyltransferase [Chloroflexi bacterium HGW-Chloroflexi-4]